MRDYSKVSPRFWMGQTGKTIKAQGSDAVIVALYLMTSPHSNMLGLYYCPMPFIVHETGLTLQGASKGLRRGIEAGFCAYDDLSEMVWVYEMAKFQIGDMLDEKDNRVKGIQKEYDALPECPFLHGFFEKYRDRFHLKIARGFEGALEGVRSQEQEQEQEQEKEITIPDGIVSGKEPDHGEAGLSNSKKNGRAPYAKIVTFLNEKAGTSFKPNNKTTVGHIRARWNEGFRLEDFHAVIEHKCNEWLTDDRMVQFLRPQTLFAGKFESYLQVARGNGGKPVNGKIRCGECSYNRGSRKCANLQKEGFDAKKCGSFAPGV